MKPHRVQADTRMGLVWWELLSNAIRTSRHGGVMLPAPEHAFHLLCDLNDAFADLSKAMDKWHLLLDQDDYDTDTSEVLIALGRIKLILNKIDQGDI